MHIGSSVAISSDRTDSDDCLSKACSDPQTVSEEQTFAAKNDIGPPCTFTRFHSVGFKIVIDGMGQSMVVYRSGPYL